MPGASSNSRKSGRKARPRRRSDTSLSSRELQLYRTLVSTLLVLNRGKPKSVTRQRFMEIIGAALALIPEAGNLGPVSVDYPIGLSHLFTLWRSTPGYLKDGLPRPLPLRGRFPSIQSLIHEVDPNVDPETALELLASSQYLKKVGPHYLPAQTLMSLRGTQYHAELQVRSLGALAANLDHNAARGKTWPSWREQTAECPRVPISKLEHWREYVFRQSEQQLKDYDAYLHRLERSRKPNERTTPAGIMIVQYERSYRQQSRDFTQITRRLVEQFAASGPTPAQRKRRTSR